MKKITTLLLSGGLALVMSAGFAGSITDVNSKWTCTTNASSASTDAEKAADDKMSKTVSSATEAYALAVQNCRDCTKITCEVTD